MNLVINGVVIGKALKLQCIRQYRRCKTKAQNKPSLCKQVPQSMKTEAIVKSSKDKRRSLSKSATWSSLRYVMGFSQIDEESDADQMQTVRPEQSDRISLVHKDRADVIYSLSEIAAIDAGA